MQRSGFRYGRGQRKKAGCYDTAVKTQVLLMNLMTMAKTWTTQDNKLLDYFQWIKFLGKGAKAEHLFGNMKKKLSKKYVKH